MALARSSHQTGLPGALAVAVLLTACAGPATRPPEPPLAPAEGAIHPPPPVTAPTPVEARPAPELPHVTIAAVGDIMLGTDFPSDRLPPHDGAELLKGMSAHLQEADIAFGNLEGVLLDGGQPAKKCGSGGFCYVFRTPARYAAHLAEAGFDVFSLANNHARDFGEDGRSATMATLDGVGIRHSGREGTYASWEVKGLKVALVAYAPYAGNNNLLDVPGAVETVGQLASEHDLVIVSFHGGAEGGDVTRLPFGPEMYRGEARGDLVTFARAVVDAGADLVLGHGPHVPRALELYRNRLIAYSLGNFATYQGIKVTGNNGLAPLLQVRLSGTGEFVEGRIVSARQLRPQGPVPDPEDTAARLMAELTLADFPDTPLSFTEDGRISRRPQPLNGGPAIAAP